LSEFVHTTAKETDLFADSAGAQRRLGVECGDWPEWTDDFDDPAFSRSVLGLDQPDDEPAS
jgi:hypothetical protein